MRSESRNLPSKDWPGFWGWPKIRLGGRSRVFLGNAGMAATLQLTISGQETSQRLQKTLAEGQSVLIGRATNKGWRIPWDNMISREHATLQWSSGRLHVTCLKQ